MHSSRPTPRPNFSRVQSARGAYSTIPHHQLPMYQGHVSHGSPPQKHFPPRLPSLTRQHHSYYDDRGPLPPPPHSNMHFRHPSREELEYEYRRRPSGSPNDPKSGPYPRHYGHHSSFPSASSPSVSMHSSMRGSSATSITSSGSFQQLTYRGHIKTTKDAILLLAACDLPENAGAGWGGRAIPPRRVTRRLLDSERGDLICSGSIFVWDEKEAGMRRWTDGKCWSASRVSGCFLTYRELEARKKPSSSITGGPTSNLYKADGLIKQSFSMTTTSGRKLHAISYYTKRDVREGPLRRVSEDPRFVGEGGGEWGLQIDEHEYPDPTSRAGMMQDGQAPEESGSQSPLGLQRPEQSESDSVTPDEREEITPVSPTMRVRSQAISALPRRSPKNAGGPVWDEAPPPPEDVLANLKGHKFEERSRPSYLQDPTPLHEARGLLLIEPIPVHSRLSDSSFRANGRSFEAPASYSPSSSAAQQDQGHSGSYFRYPMQNWPKPGMKRGYADSRDAHESKPQRPRLERKRSSSMSNGNQGEVPTAAVRSLGRANSDDGVSQIRSTSTWSPARANGAGREQDSAVGALLSLRSLATDEAGKPTPLFGSKTPATTTPNSSDSNESLSPKPSVFSRSDRAALDRFTIKI